MSYGTIAKTRDRLSQIVASVASGEEAEHYIKNRDKVIAKIVPVDDEPSVAQRIGIAKDDPAFAIDDELFNQLDAQIAQDFGV